MIKLKNQNLQDGHIHLFVPVIVVVLAIAAVGWFVYQKNNKVSKVTDTATIAEIKQDSAKLKNVNLGAVQSTVVSVNSVQNSTNYKKANGL